MIYFPFFPRRLLTCRLIFLHLSMFYRLEVLCTPEAEKHEEHKNLERKHATEDVCTLQLQIYVRVN